MQQVEAVGDSQGAASLLSYNLKDPAFSLESFAIPYDLILNCIVNCITAHDPLVKTNLVASHRGKLGRIPPPGASGHSAQIGA